MSDTPTSAPTGTPTQAPAGTYGDNYDLMANEAQRAAYVAGWNDAKSGAGNNAEVYGLMAEYYGFGYIDASS